MAEVAGIDIHDPLSEICDRLGLEPRNVRELQIRPADAVATVYRIRDGHKYVNDDGSVATDTLRFTVRT